MQIEQNSAAGPLIAAPTSGRHWTLSRALAVTCLLVGLVAATEAVAVPAQIGVDVHATPARLLPGATAHYVVEVRNSGGMQAGARLGVAIPEGLQNAAWTCVAHAGSRCSAATASGNLNQSLDGLAAGSALEFHLDARVSSAPPAFVDLQASTSLPTGARCADGQTAPCRARASLPAGAGVVLDLSSSATALLAGQVVQYSITARTDTVHASTAGSVLRSPVPNGLINSHWTCQSSAGACAQAQGTGSIEQVLGNFSGSELRFDITAEVAANPPVTSLRRRVRWRWIAESGLGWRRLRGSQRPGNDTVDFRQPQSGLQRGWRNGFKSIRAREPWHYGRQHHDFLASAGTGIRDPLDVPGIGHELSSVQRYGSGVGQRAVLAGRGASCL